MPSINPPEAACQSGQGYGLPSATDRSNSAHVYMREIGQMTGWLQIADAPIVSSLPMAWMMTDHDMPMPMPGMASPADLTRLQRATGRANEILFLQLMTRHHQGGIDMAAYAVAHSKTNAVHQTAVAMIDEQSQELIFMAYLLQQRKSTPLAYP